MALLLTHLPATWFVNAASQADIIIIINIIIGINIIIVINIIIIIINIIITKVTKFIILDDEHKESFESSLFRDRKPPNKSQASFSLNLFINILVTTTTTMQCQHQYHQYSPSLNQGMLITTAMRGTDFTDFADLGLTRAHVEQIVHFFNQQ